MLKDFFKKILGFFLSLRTAIWLLLALLLLLLFGALLMPTMEGFKSMNSMPLFQWLRENPPVATWWLWGSIILLSLLTANTLVCSIESVIKKRARPSAEKMGGRQWLLVISPQVIHIGFLFMLLAHLMSSAGGFRGRVVAYEGSNIMLPDNESTKIGSAKTVLRVKALTVEVGPMGYPRDWRADIEYLSGGKKLKGDYLSPNRPSFYRGLGIYLKEIRAYPVKSCLLEISREPGSTWALIGGILFMTGTVLLIGLKVKREG